MPTCPCSPGFDTIAMDWGDPATPSNLPGGNGIGFSADLSVDSDPPPSQTGIQEGEMATFVLILNAGKSIADVARAIADGSLRLGMHVQSIAPSGNSDGFVNIPVPLPAAGWMGLALLGSLGLAKKTRRMTA